METPMESLMEALRPLKEAVRKYCPMEMKCLKDHPTCESCKKPYRVDLVEEDGFDWLHVPQGFFDTKEEAFALREELIEKGFEYIAVVHNA